MTALSDLRLSSVRLMERTPMIKVHFLNGSPAVVCNSADAVRTLAEMLGHAADALRVSATGWVSLWTYRCAGEIVGRLESL